MHCDEGTCDAHLNLFQTVRVGHSGPFMISRRTRSGFRQASQVSPRVRYIRIRVSVGTGH